MANPGTRLFTYANIAPESTPGTPVAPTRQLYMAGDGMFSPDFGLDFHETENRGLRTRTTRAPTSQAEDVTVTLSDVDGTSYDELVYAFACLLGTATGTGGSADKTWTQTPGQTASSNSPKTFTLDVGDDTQNWRLQYVQWQTIKLAASVGGLTSLNLAGFAQRAVKGAKATPATNAAVKIPGDLWTVKFAASIAALTGASISTNFLLDWDLELTTGLNPRHYMDGNVYFGQSVESDDISGVLNMTVESTALAVSEFYDKYVASTIDFIRLKAIGPVLGGTFYSSQIDLPVYYDKPDIISGEDNGVNTYKIPARLAYDPTSAKSVQLVTVNTLATL
jgi:hypothetical protein